VPAAAYISAGLTIARDPETGAQNVAIHRCQISGPDRIGILLLPRHTDHFFRKAEAAGQGLEVALVIGVDPATLLSSQAIVPVGFDELSIAGALRGRALDVVRCKTNAVRVPAEAEIVIEGRLLPNTREPEGPFGEFPQYYGERADRHVLHVDCVTHRVQPIFHTIVGGGLEHLLLGAIPREATILATLQRNFPGVQDVHLSLGGVGRYHLYIKLRKTQDGEGKNVLLGAFAAHYDIKHAVVVDVDVDIHNPAEVEWALATRFQADQDAVIIAAAQGSKLDPSNRNGVGAKMGFDATIPVGLPEMKFKRIAVPGQDAVDRRRLATVVLRYRQDIDGKLTAPVHAGQCNLDGRTFDLALAPPKPHARLLMYGVLLMGLATAMYLAGVLFAPIRHLIGGGPRLLAINEWIVWYSGVPLVVGLCLAGVDLFVLLRVKRSPRDDVRHDPIHRRAVIVALTAYDDADSIGDAVRDFRAHPAVGAVIVVSNNSRDRTMACAAEAGAIAVNETRQGYGYCVYRCLSEALAQADYDLVVLCEGDRTFRAYDIDKLLAYAPHADIVNGTRTVERLRARTTQLSTFMYYGNLFVGKLLEAKHLGASTITDVGTTYKLCRREALVRLLPQLRPAVNLEFNAHFLDVALGYGFDIVECPITFHPRVGVSKGGNVSNRRALRVGLRMVFGIVCSWRPLAT
jgi:2,5-furandicarboxylate decarboxylase 1